MREAIRYRVFDGKKMWYPEDAKDPSKQFMVAMNGEVWIPCGVAYNLVEMQPTDAIAMLSTGMKDKNGNEVWVGDTVRFDPEDDWEFVRAEVQFRAGSFILWHAEPEYVYEIGEVASGAVVGNVHEDK